MDTGPNPPLPVAASPVARMCETWPQYVRAACYTDLNSFDAIHAWVQGLRDRDQLQPGVQFTIEDDYGVPRGVPRGMLYDPNADPMHRWVVLRCGQYLVHHGDRTLEVLDELTFHTRYRYPDRQGATSGPVTPRRLVDVQANGSRQ